MQGVFSKYNLVGRALQLQLHLHSKIMTASPEVLKWNDRVPFERKGKMLDLMMLRICSFVSSFSLRKM